MATFYCARCLTRFDDAVQACPNDVCGAPEPPSGWGAILDPGDLLDRHYLIGRCLAVGSAGLTYLARETSDDGAPTGPALAVKVLYSARAAGPFLRRLSNEAQILQELAHAHIVQLRGFVHRAGHEPYLVTLFEEGGSLADHVDRVGPVPPRIAGAILEQVLLALDVAHQAGVVHRDLKPDNVLLSRAVGPHEVPHCRVGDFGVATTQGTLASSAPAAFVGTPEYAAPEQFEGGAPGPPTDVFAAGGLLTYLLTGKPPVFLSDRGNLKRSLAELLQQVPPRLAPRGVDASDAEVAELQRILTHMMARQPAARWTVQETLQGLGPLAAERAPLFVPGPPPSPPDLLLDDALDGTLDRLDDKPPRPPPSFVDEDGRATLAAPAPPPLAAQGPLPHSPVDVPAHERPWSPVVAPTVRPSRIRPMAGPGLGAAFGDLEAMSDAPPAPALPGRSPPRPEPLAERLGGRGAGTTTSAQVVAVRASASSSSAAPASVGAAPLSPHPHGASLPSALTVPAPSAQLGPRGPGNSRAPRHRLPMWGVGVLLVLGAAAGLAVAAALGWVAPLEPWLRSLIAP